jgi:glyoxylase-like metal-dependent hydrolase (beta-lactamase superfamily II)
MAQPIFGAQLTTGLFDMLVPRAFDGPPATPSAYTRVVEELARFDESAAWNLLIWGSLSSTRSPHIWAGHLLDALAGLDVPPEEVDVVIPSHLHLDHIGWNTRPGPDGQPVITFPNATYMFHEADWDYFTDPARLNRNDPTSRRWSTPACCQ